MCLAGIQEDPRRAMPKRAQHRVDRFEPTSFCNQFRTSPEVVFSGVSRDACKNDGASGEILPRGRDCHSCRVRRSFGSSEAGGTDSFPRRADRCRPSNRCRPRLDRRIRRRWARPPGPHLEQQLPRQCPVPGTSCHRTEPRQHLGRSRVLIDSCRRYGFKLVYRAGRRPSFEPRESALGCRRMPRADATSMVATPRSRRSGTGTRNVDPSLRAPGGRTPPHGGKPLLPPRHRPF